MRKMKHREANFQSHTAYVLAELEFEARQFGSKTCALIDYAILSKSNVNDKLEEKKYLKLISQRVNLPNILRAPPKKKANNSIEK